MHDTRVITGHESYFTVGFSKLDSLVCLTSTSGGVPLVEVKQWGNSLFLNHSHGADLAFSIADQSAQKACPPEPIMLWLSWLQWKQWRHSNCCGAFAPVCCWRHPLFSWTASRDVVLSQPKWFTSEWCFQAIQIAVILFCFLKHIVLCKWNLGVGHYFLFFPPSYSDHFHALSSFFPSGLWIIPFLKVSKMSLWFWIAVLLSSVLRYACEYPAYFIDII